MINMDKENFIKFRSQFKTDLECAKALNISKTKYYDLKASFGLVKNYNTVANIDYNTFMYWYNQGLNDREIGEKLNVSQKSIFAFRTRNQLKNNVDKHLFFTEEQLQIFLGCMLGDGSMYIPNDCKNAYFSFAHSQKQRDYCYWKYEQLQNLCFNPREYAQFDKRTQKEYYRIDVRTYTNSLFTNYYNNFYHTINGQKIKYINKELLYQLKPLGLAVWFMDDGYKEDCGYVLSTNSFAEDDIEIIINFFEEKFNIITSVHKSKILYIKAKYRETFTNLIKDYIHPTLLYKLHYSPE